MATWKNASKHQMMLEWGELVKPLQGHMKCKCFNIERRIETLLTEVITASFFLQ